MRLLMGARVKGLGRCGAVQWSFSVGMAAASQLTCEAQDCPD